MIPTCENYVNYVNETSRYVQVTRFSLSTLRTLRFCKSRHIVLSSGLVVMQSCPRCGITDYLEFIFTEPRSHFACLLCIVLYEEKK